MTRRARQRRLPAIAIGNYVMFGWQDDSDEHPGCTAKREQSEDLLRD